MYRKVLNYLRGQVTVEVESAAPERVLNLCAAHGIPFWGLTWLSELRLRAAIDRAELPRLRQVLTQTDAVLTVVRTEGAPEVWRQYRRRYVLLAAAGLLMLMMALGSTHIWAFQVTGNDTVPTETILRTLEKYGVALGARSRIRQEELRNHVLLELPDVVWLTVNMRGCTAHVQVVERQRPPHLYTDGEITNVVAARDGLVTSVQALDGEAQVMAGSTVTAGQLLISGAVQTEGPERPNVPSRLLAGRGQVRGRTWYELSIRVPLQYEEKRYTDDEKHSFALLVGERRVKFGAKGSSNLQGSCDKIIHQTKLSLPGGMALPLTWEETTLRPYETRTVTRTRTEAEELGARTLSAYLLTRIDGAVTTTRVASAVQGDWLLVTLSAECLEQIGETVPILTD